MTLAVITSSVAFISYGGLLTLVSRSGSRNRLRWMFSFYVLDMLLLQAVYLMVSLARNEQAALFWYTFTIPLSLGQVVIYFFFTRAFLEIKSSRKLMQVSAAIWLLIVILCVVFRSSVMPNIYRDPATGLFVPEIGELAIVLMMPVLIFLGATVRELIKGYQSRFHLQRVRVQYLLLAILIFWVGMVANGFATLRPYPIDVMANIVSAILITFAILRYQLLDINIAIRKGLVYSVSVSIMGIGYFITIFLITRLFIWDESNPLLISFAAAVIVVGVLTPLRDRTQAWIDRALFREKYDGTVMIQRLSQTAASILHLDDLARMILGDIVETMHIHWAVLLLEQDKGFYPIAQKGLDAERQLILIEGHPLLRWLAADQTVITIEFMREMLAQGTLSQKQFDELTRINSRMIIPLTAKDRLVGVLGLGPKLSQQHYSQDDEIILTTLANQVAIAIDNARLYETVQRELAERISAEAEREKLIAQLEAKNTELEGFTYTVSHDLKAPLLTINGFLGFLEKDALTGNTERMRADISHITEATNKMQRLLTELLELSRVGRMLNTPETINFSDLVHEAMDNVHGQLEIGRVTVKIQPDLPAVFGDRQRLVEVMQNLIDNAAKFMGDQPDPRIEIGQYGEDVEHGKPIFYVKDNGIGIDSAHLERIFGLFNKLDPRAEGTGIGLAIVKRIVEVHGGRIWVESEAGKGSTFLFTLAPIDRPTTIQAQGSPA
jgi:K+-sensing histidine kinase KdpD